MANPRVGSGTGFGGAGGSGGPGGAFTTITKPPSGPPEPPPGAPKPVPEPTRGLATRGLVPTKRIFRIFFPIFLGIGFPEFWPLDVGIVIF